MDQENPSNIEAVTHELIQLPPDNYPEAIRLCKLHNLLPVEAAIALEESYVPKCTKKIVGFDLDNHIVAGYGLFVPRASNPEAKQEVQQPPKPPSSSREPDSIDGATFAKEIITKPTPALNDFFDHGDKVVIIGQSKTRKSFFSLQLAIKLAIGQSFLGLEPPEPKKVLIVQFEIRKTWYQNRYQRMLKELHADELPELKNIFFLNARGYGADTDELKTLIKKQVEKRQPDIVIIDPLYKLIVGDESKSEEIKPILRFFDYLAESTKAAVVYIHHDKKGFSGDQQLTDRGAGSGVLARDFDAGMFLSPHATEEDTLVIDFITRNHPPIKEICVKWENYHFVHSDADPVKMTSRNQANKKLKNDELVEKGLKAVQKLMAQGISSLAVSLFNAKLEDTGVPVKKTTLVKDSLEAEGYISFERPKAKSGGSCKIVHLLKGLDEGKTEFQQAFEESNDIDDIF